MTKLLHRIDGKLQIRKDDGRYEPVKLEQLVHAGSELIGFNADPIFAGTMASKMALELGREYLWDYVLLGNNPLRFNKSLRDVPNYVYIATFYNERKKAVLKSIKYEN